MIIGVYTNDSKYKELFQEGKAIELALILDPMKMDNDINVELEALLIDGKAISYQEIGEIRESFPDIPMFYKLHDIKSAVFTKNIERICKANKVEPINEHFTIEQVVNKVISAITGDEKNGNNRVISFFGTHSGVGVSTTVFSVAKSISERTQEKILVLSLNAWDPSDYFYQYDGQYLNDLKVELKTKSLTPEKLGASVTQNKNFYHLAGNRDIKLQRFYKNEEISHLIDVAKKTFDLILIDGGTHFDTAIASQSYVSSNLRFLVTSQDDKGYRGYFPHVFQQILEPSGATRSDFMLILNKHQQNMSLISEKDIEEELEINRIATLPDMDIMGRVSIRQHKFLYDMAEGSYQKGIDTISNLIISEGSLTEKDIETVGAYQKKGFLGFLKK